MPVHSILLKAASHVYKDLQAAETFLRNYQRNGTGDLFSVVFVKPGGLVQAAQQSHTLSLEASKTFTSFVDCATGMVEIASLKDSGNWDGKDVSVNSAAAGGAAVGLTEGIALFRALLRGIILHIFPWAYAWL